MSMGKEIKRERGIREKQEEMSEHGRRKQERRARRKGARET
jgi:hypothetical protein